MSSTSTTIDPGESTHSHIGMLRTSSGGGDGGVEDPVVFCCGVSSAVGGFWIRILAMSWAAFNGSVPYEPALAVTVGGAATPAAW